MTLILELTAEEEARLNAAAQLHRADQATYAKQLVTGQLPLEVPSTGDYGDYGGKSLYDVFGDLFGTVDYLPSDVSTNPEYIRGFGERNPQPWSFATRASSSR